MVFFGWILIILVSVYVLLILISIAGFFKKPAEQEKKDFRVSVILPVRNEEKNLDIVIPSLLAQRHPYYEIIIANDHSSDRTKEIAEKYIQQFPGKIKWTESEEGCYGKKQALLKGINEASGEIIFTTDADCVHHREWLSKMAAAFGNEKIKMAAGTVLIKKPSSFFEHIQQLDQLSLTAVSAGTMRMGWPLMCSGANLAFRKKDFYATGKYKGHLHEKSGDDVFLMFRMADDLGKEAIDFSVSPETAVQTTPSYSVSAFLSQHLRWGEKAKRYYRFFPLFVAILTVLIPLGCIAGLLLLPVYHAHFALLSISLGAKAAIDFLLLFLTGRVLGASASLWYFVPAFFFHLFYVPVVALAALVSKKAEWK